MPLSRVVEELDSAVSKLIMGKAGNGTGTLTELIVHRGTELWERLMELMQKVWEEQKVVSDWWDAVMIVPILKKDDFYVCDNWRGISLLDVVGKRLARVMLERLQHIAEGILPDSQCGCRTWMR